MRIFTLSGLLGVAMLTGATVSYAQQNEPRPYVLYRGVTIIDATGGAPARNMAILTHGEKIEAIGREIAPPSGAKTVDVRGLYASPGLVNSHEHIATPPNRPFALAVMKKDVYGGVTTMRDMADDLRQVADLARASRVGEIPGPDIYYAALMAGPEFFKDPRVQAASQGVAPGQAPWMRAVTAATDLRLAVAEAHGTGATAIKIYADLPPDLVSAIIREAHHQGMLAWAHAAVFPTKPEDEALADVDTMSHVCMLAYQASQVMPRAYHNRAGVDEAKFANGIDPSVLRVMSEMKSRGIILDATLDIYSELAAEFAAHPKGPKPYCSPGLAARLTTAAYHAGVMISAGTDTVSPDSDPWPALQTEMEALQKKAGMKPADVIRAATMIGARTMGVQGEIGTLERGKLANIVFTRDDPTLDVKAYRTVVLTVKRGTDYWRKDYVLGPTNRSSPK